MLKYLFLLFFISSNCLLAADYPENSSLSATGNFNGFYFVENKGQLSADQEVLFIAQSDQERWLISRKGLKRIQWRSSKSLLTANQKTDFSIPKYQMESSQVFWKAPSAALSVEARMPAGFYLNYPSHQVNKLPAYKELLLRNLYEGVNLLLYEKEGRLNFEFEVNEGANLKSIKLHKLIDEDTVSSISSEKDKNKALNHSLKLVPVVKTQSSNSRHFFQGVFEFDKEIHSYSIADKNGNSGSVPMQVWDIYYGGESSDFGWSTCSDPQGNVYMAGYTFSPNEIATKGHQIDYAGSVDAFLVKFDSDGNRLWATYFGGHRIDKGFKVSSDSQGNIYLAGHSRSTKGIAFGASYQKQAGGSMDAFLAKFDPEGKLLWSTYLGGGGEEEALDVSCDASDNVYLAGHTESAEGIARNGGQSQLRGETDAFLAKFSPSGSLLWSTYAGGSDKDYGRAVAVSPAGIVYLAGVAYSENGFGKLRNGSRHSGGSDVFLSAYSASGSVLWSVMFGGKSIDDLRALHCDLQGNIFLAGYTFSREGMATEGTYQQEYGGGSSDAYVAKFNDSGKRIWCSYFGGSKRDRAYGLVADRQGNVLLAGGSESFQELDIQEGHAIGGTDAFLIKFDRQGAKEWAMVYGSENEDYGRSVALDALGNILLSGSINNNAAFLVKYREEECKEPKAGFEVIADKLKCSFNDLSSNIDTDAEYLWDINNDGITDYTTKGTIEHIYPEKGTFTCTLTIRQGGCQSVFQAKVIIEE